MLIDRGLNDRWPRPSALERVGAGWYAVTLTEPLVRFWSRQIVTYPLPAELRDGPVQTFLGAEPVPCQVSGELLFLAVTNLHPGEKRTYDIQKGDPNAWPPPGSDSVRLESTPAGTVFTNGLISLLLPISWTADAGDPPEPIPGPILAVRRGETGPWLGSGRLEVANLPVSIETRKTIEGPLWTTVEINYRFGDRTEYRIRLSLSPDDPVCEVRERSDLPVRLWPAPRPCREIGSLGASHWKQERQELAKPCLRPCPAGNFIFDLAPGLAPDRLVTHSTSSWEIMDLPLGSPTVRTYTAMRPANPFIDGGWLGTYNSGGDDLLGVVPVDICHWRIPDETIHPAHRTPGASAEVFLVDAADSGPHFRFPVENIRRHWLLALLPRDTSAAAPDTGQPRRFDPDPQHPLWALHRDRGALPLEKVKDWISEWPETEIAHPRVLCRRDDFGGIRHKVQTVPELRRLFAETGPLRAADRYMLTGEVSGLASIEAATHGRELVETILRNGYAGPLYAIGLARPLRRYALACDVVWDSLQPAEKKEAWRVCALAAYILSDGDWRQYTFRPNETTYLPNFNTDVFCCYGIIGLFLADHPCARTWTTACVARMDIELSHHLRLDGGGEENVGSYLQSTWTQLYMPLLWALRHCGIKDYSAHPHVLAGARFFLKTLGPPDPRDGGLRTIPPIGHHPQAHKAFPYVAWLAAFIHDAAPELAANLMWAWRASGAPVGNWYDHSGPTANPFTRHYLFHNPAIPEIPPDLESVNLPFVGAVLRTHPLTDKGSCLFIKAGRIHSHHEEDEGAIHYFGRGVPFALDGLRMENGAPVDEHNVVSFARPGQPTATIEAFATTPVADYVRARIVPRGFCNDAMYGDDHHRSGFERQIVLVKADEPGEIEYVVVKDVCTGPDACQWNLDVLSRKPVRKGPARLWFPGHPELNMGLDLAVLEPASAKLTIAAGPLSEAVRTPEARAKLPPHFARRDILEHWLLHLPAGPGSTFVVLLFPRRPDEPAPALDYLDREETLAVEHATGTDLIFLRPNPAVGINLHGIRFQGRAGVVSWRGPLCHLGPLDAIRLERTDGPPSEMRFL